MLSLNKVTLIGRVGSDPEIRTNESGKSFATFSLATPENWKDRITGERKEKTEWHKIVVFNDGLANIIKSYVKKGSKLYIEGSLQTRKWTDTAGQEKYTTEVVLQNYNANLILLDQKANLGYNNDSNMQANQSHANAKSGYSMDLDDDIPF